MTKQNPTDQQNLSQWELYKAAPRERRMNVVSEFETIYGEAPSGAHEAEPRWVIWKETKDESGRITLDYAQEGRNDLIWLYNESAFDPIPNPDGTPYAIQLDNNIVYDGMGAPLPVANITVLDIDDVTHTIQIIQDPFDKFQILGNVLALKNSVQLIDVAYPLKLRAIDDEGKSFDQWFAIYVQEMPPGTPASFTGELNVYAENNIVTGDTVTLIDYDVPSDRGLRLRMIEGFGKNLGGFEILIDDVRVAYKETYYTHYHTEFDFENFELEPDQNIKVKVTNRNNFNTALFNARLRGYQYVV